MKKGLLIVATLTLFSCDKILDDTPKCEDPDILQTAIQIMDENIPADAQYLISEIGQRTGQPNFKFTLKASNIRTNFRNKESKSCDCTADFDRINFDVLDSKLKQVNPDANLEEVLKRKIPNMHYTAQKNSEGNINVEVYND